MAFFFFYSWKSHIFAASLMLNTKIMSFAKIPEFERNGMKEKPDSFKLDIQAIKFENRSDNQNPEYVHSGDSGFDLRAWITESDEGAKFDKNENKYKITLKSLERRLIHTGLYFNLPQYTEMQVRPRSGMALKQGLGVVNSPGTVDANYTNEVGVIAINMSNKPITITSGDRIAQAVLMPVYCKELVKLEQVEKVEENDSRNLNGFGSSGVK